MADMKRSGAFVLAGGGPWTAGGGLARVAAAAGTTSVTVLPTAGAFDDARSAVAALAVAVSGSTPELTVSSVDIFGRHDAERTDFAAQLAAAKCTVAIGESSMHLRSVVKATPAWDAIVDNWVSGATFVGVGWSAAALGDPMIDPRGGALTLGLGLVPISILPGADHWGAERTKRTLKMAKGWLVTLDSAAAAIWTPSAGWVADGPGVHAYFGGQERPLANLPAPTGGPSA
jgi:cyanophycinase